MYKPNTPKYDAYVKDLKIEVRKQLDPFKHYVWDLYAEKGYSSILIKSVFDEVYSEIVKRDQEFETKHE